VVLRARLSNLFNKTVRQMTILTDFGNLYISLKQTDILPKKLSSSFCHTLGYLPEEYERNRIFDPCRVICHIYGQGLLTSLKMFKLIKM